MPNSLVPLIKRLSDLQIRNEKINNDIADVIDKILVETEKQIKKTPETKKLVSKVSSKKPKTVSKEIKPIGYLKLLNMDSSDLPKPKGMKK